MDERTKKRIDKKTKEFMKSARSFLLAKAGGVEIPAEWELSIYMLEIYFKQFLELNEEISAMDTILVQSKYGLIVSPLCSARDKAAVRLESLNENRGGVEMTAADAADNLSKELISSFFGGIIRERKPSVGLNDANSGEIFEVEAFGEGLGADQDINFAGTDLIIERIEGFGLFVIAVETGDIGGFKKFF